MERGEPITLVPREHERVRRWRTRSPAQEARQVTLGRGGDRWYVELIGQIHTEPRAYPTKEQATQVAEQVKAANGTNWQEIPAQGGY